MIDAAINWYAEKPEWLKWLLYLPTFIVGCILISIPAMIFLHFANRDVWAWAGGFLAGCAIAYISNALSMFLAPRFKKSTATFSTGIFSLAALATIGNKVVWLFNAAPPWAQEQATNQELLWAIGWLVTTCITIFRIKQ
jgi:hypothetical protein